MNDKINNCNISSKSRKMSKCPLERMCLLLNVVYNVINGSLPVSEYARLLVWYIFIFSTSEETSNGLCCTCDERTLVKVSGRERIIGHDQSLNKASTLEVSVTITCAFNSWQHNHRRLANSFVYPVSLARPGSMYLLLCFYKGTRGWFKAM